MSNNKVDMLTQSISEKNKLIITKQEELLIDNKEVRNQEIKFEYAFSVLIFTFLGLSLQKSLEFGLEYIYTLFVAWFSLTISAISSGIRIRKIPTSIQNINTYKFLKLKLNAEKEALRDTEQIKKITKLQFKTDYFKDRVRKTETLIKNHKSKNNKLELRLAWLQGIQIGCFLAAIFAHGLFIYSNLTEQYKKNHETEITQTKTKIVYEKKEMPRL